jgi:hypothetical protein
MAAAGCIDWSDADLLARLKRRAGEGMSARAIAREFSQETGREFTCNMIVSACQRNGVALKGNERRKMLAIERARSAKEQPPAAGHGKPRWTQAEDAKIARLFRDGASATEIARAMSAARQAPVTRSAVIGRLFRIGMLKRGAASHAETSIQAAKRRQRLALADGIGADAQWTDPTLKARRRGLPPLAAKRLSDAPHDPAGCRFIEGEVLRAGGGEGKWRYCNRAPDEGSPWCAHHRARATVRKYVRDENAPAARRRQRRAGFFDFSAGG